jgi:TonB family protein
MTRSGWIARLEAVAALLLWTSTLAAALPSSSAPAIPGPPQGASGSQIVFSFRNADLQDALPEFGRLLAIGPIISVDSNVKGTITVDSSGPMSRENTFRLLLRILTDNKAMLVRAGELNFGYRVVPFSTMGLDVVSELPPALPGPSPATATGVQSPQREPLRVMSNIQELKLIKKVEPVCAELALKAGVFGTVLLDVLLNEGGEVANVRIYHGHPLLSLSALEAVKQWRYAPTYLNNEAVPVVTTISMTFARPGAPPASVGAPPVGTVQVPRSEPVRVAGNIQESKLVSRVEPIIPEPAMRARIVARVILEVVINEQGEVFSATYMRGHPLLHQSVVDAVKQWRYAPRFVNGVAVPVITTVTVPINLR